MPKTCKCCQLVAEKYRKFPESVKGKNKRNPSNDLGGKKSRNSPNDLKRKSQNPPNDFTEEFWNSSNDLRDKIMKFINCSQRKYCFHHIVSENKRQNLSHDLEEIISTFKCSQDKNYQTHKMALKKKIALLD